MLHKFHHMFIPLDHRHDEKNGPPSCSLAPDEVLRLGTMGAKSCVKILLVIEALRDLGVYAPSDASTISRCRFAAFNVPSCAGRRFRSYTTLSLLLPDPCQCRFMLA